VGQRCKACACTCIGMFPIRRRGRGRVHYSPWRKRSSGEENSYTCRLVRVTVAEALDTGYPRHVFGGEGWHCIQHPQLASSRKDAAETKDLPEREKQD